MPLSKPDVVEKGKEIRFEVRRRRLHPASPSSSSSRSIIVSVEIHRRLRRDLVVVSVEICRRLRRNPSSLSLTQPATSKSVVTLSHTAGDKRLRESLCLADLHSVFATFSMVWAADLVWESSFVWLKIQINPRLLSLGWRTGELRCCWLHTRWLWACW